MSVSASKPGVTSFTSSRIECGGYTKLLRSKSATETVSILPSRRRVSDERSGVPAYGDVSICSCWSTASSFVCAAARPGASATGGAFMAWTACGCIHILHGCVRHAARSGSS
jgi:hypothetical protein